MSAIARARRGFIAAFGIEPQGVIIAPGRVNLIGDHVDYNDGLVLPMTISVGTAIAWGPSGSDRVDAVALDCQGERYQFCLGDPKTPSEDGWHSYLKGMAMCSAEAGLPIAGARMAIAGSLPRGAGLSSSASLCIAAGRALAAAAGESAPDPTRLALSAQAAEHRFAGVKCGIMDQMVIAHGQPATALLIDCRDLGTQTVCLPATWAVLIVQSGVERELVDGHYNQRRQDCETAAQALRLKSLREATLEQIAGASLPSQVERRARHVVTEIARTKQTIAAIADADLNGFGQLLVASHASLRDDFDVSVPEVDSLVDLLNRAIAGKGGARMTGGGFGGAVVAVLEQSALPAVLDKVTSEYRTPLGAIP
ncbi:MAG: galactokinase, partial [Pseudomonadota bacterium]